MSTALRIIEHLGLKAHPLEGGFFLETYRSADSSCRPDRSASTAIYYLLTPDTFSEMHRVATDEVFHFYAGGPVTMLQLAPGQCRRITLGPDVLAGQQPQVVVPRGVWQGSFLNPGGEYALLGATVAPGFDYADYESGQRDLLIAQFPDHAELIRRLTRGMPSRRSGGVE